MRRARRPHQAIAWLATLALCLLVLAPNVSRFVMATAMAADMGAMCEGHAHGGMPPAADPHHGDGLDACGYCTYATHNPALDARVVVVVAALPLAPPAARNTPYRAPRAIVHRPPARGPPALTPGFSTRFA